MGFYVAEPLWPDTRPTNILEAYLRARVHAHKGLHQDTKRDATMQALR